MTDAQKVMEQALDYIEQSDDKDLLTIAFMDGHAKGKAAALVQQGEQKARADLEAEMQEQCRIIGMGGQREAKLLADNERLRTTLRNLLAYANSLEMHNANAGGEHHVMQAARAALGEQP